MDNLFTKTFPFSESDIYEKIYPLVLEDVNALFDWVSGTALLPYLERW